MSKLIKFHRISKSKLRKYEEKEKKSNFIQLTIVNNEITIQIQEKKITLLRV